MERNRWYKNKVFYQIWPRSFKDGNNDGIGDLIGVYEKLDYLKSLGVDGIWFSPLYPSPNADCGYDISDYMNINPEYGTLEDFKRVLEGAHQRDMKVIMDLVVNHTSDEHEWFEKSRRRIEPYTDYYIWKDAKPDGSLPNNWDSMFEGKAWHWDEIRQQFYLHLFAIKQPDLNMDNPLVREEVKNIMKFWLDMGVDGFREDVITFISKKEGLPDDKILPIMKGIRHYNHGPNVHKYLSEFRDDILSKYSTVTLAEAPLISGSQALKYIREKHNSEIDMMIHFNHMCADCLFNEYAPLPFSLRRLKRSWSRWQNHLFNKGWNALYIENHDHPRIISRYGSEKYAKESGKTLCTAYLFQQGTPFIYQGQEIGMLNWYPKDGNMYEDVQTSYFYKNNFTFLPDKLKLRWLWRASRDSARTPVQWSSDKYAGFSKVEPWFYVNQNYTSINVAHQETDPDSILNFYKKAIQLRKSLPAIQHGRYKEFYKRSNKLYVYTRTTRNQKILVVCSFTEKPVEFIPPKGINLDSSKLLLCNYSDTRAGDNSFTTRPYECRVYEIS